MTTAPPALPPNLAQSKLTLEQFDALLTKIYEGPLEDVPWGAALEQIRVHLHANYVTMILRWPASGHTGLMINASEESAPLTGVASYNNYYYALDPFVNLPADRVVTVDELLGVGVWRNSAMYAEFLQPYDVGYLMGADLRTHDGVECRFRVCRSHRGQAFSAADKAVCNALLPHLKRAVRLHAKFGMVESERTLYASTIDRMLVGTAILDERGTIMRTNSVADEIFAECDGLRVRGGTLEASYPLEDRKLQKLIRQVLAERTGVTPSVAHAIAVPRPSGKPRLGVLIRAVPLSEWSEDNPRRPACAIFIRDAERKSQASHDIVRKLFDLTPAETALALALVNGQTLEEAADELAISKNTARSHLRAIFSKTGVTRQATLVRMLLNSVLSLG
ncbi:MAG: helix-turn-helix transcriptional regulator [Burkholderia sp.]|jgi:DNA-binding CsgD family transcriptional regulator|uniref:helix-turn-helix transcriptional regulator n=2 Tax=Burkholderiaceae TaxID=119060 RepID=UPI0015884BB7|nr:MULTISPECIES: LuxR C-terminal-related transcriptional regulator [Burkholderia]MBY8604880.1 LuxR C-terminal-related transcriptional regulator [Burkholderia arboris]MCA3778816.1 helix-turn-helix transcriptional regulator [Burkholderia sp.]MCA3791985.1 helix-turn-helix transcriptional regulator [Burkholderia sp.]MCA3800617.1 helix-turn-helix transcriptional regulator [Burkholderia sp.]MCA3808903.1 helix-turn-helix transcriptional regulator [Burkholderia sp.]